MRSDVISIRLFARCFQTIARCSVGYLGPLPLAYTTMLQEYISSIFLLCFFFVVFLVGYAALIMRTFILYKLHVIALTKLPIV